MYIAICSTGWEVKPYMHATIEVLHLDMMTSPAVKIDIERAREGPDSSHGRSCLNLRHSRYGWGNGL